MTSFKWCPCSGTGRSVGCNRLVLSLDLITGMPAFVTDAYISNRHLDKAIPVIKPNDKTIQQGLTGPVWRLQTFNDIMNLWYVLLKYYHFLYYFSTLNNIPSKKSIKKSFSLSEVSCFWLPCGIYEQTAWLSWNETQMHIQKTKKF